MWQTQPALYNWSNRSECHLPGGVVNKSQLAKIIPLLKRSHCAFAMNDDIHRTPQDDVPGSALIALMEH